MLSHNLTKLATRPVARNASRQLLRFSKNRVQNRTFLTIVQQGFEGWRLTLGSNPVKLEPGLRVMIPFYHSVQQVNMRETSVRGEF